MKYWMGAPTVGLMGFLEPEYHSEQGDHNCETSVRYEW